MDCVFCKIVAGTIPCVKVYENAETIAFMDINPLTPGHLLVVSKTHMETLFQADEDQVAALARVAVRIAKSLRGSLGIDALNLLQANGAAAYQSVPHLHIHLIPRRPDDGAGFDWKLVPGNMDAIRELGERVKAGLG
jgi:histidine triad (HIT) family protein